MLKFLFRGKKAETKVETNRESFERVVTELNALIAAQPVKPKLILDPESGAIALDLPEQLADEALALPAPDESETTAEVEADADEAPAEEKEEKSAA